jgi:SAM-dependent methyltransferase
MHQGSENSAIEVNRRVQLDDLEYLRERVHRRPSLQHALPANTVKEAGRSGRNSAALLRHSLRSEDRTDDASQRNPDIDALKTRLTGHVDGRNYDYFSRFMESSAVDLLDRLDIPAGMSLLDVACGSGQLGLIAARRGIKVTGVDIATNAILRCAQPRERRGLDARFDEGDAEALPYAGRSFDVVASLFGAMFAPRPERVAAELLRVCRPGGTIAMANWTAGGFIGTMFKTSRVHRAAGMPAPCYGGDERTVTERSDQGCRTAIDPRLLSVRLSVRPADVVDFFRENYGPTTRAFGALGEANEKRFARSLFISGRRTTPRRPNRTIVDSDISKSSASVHDIPLTSEHRQKEHINEQKVRSPCRTDRTGSPIAGGICPTLCRRHNGEPLSAARTDARAGGPSFTHVGRASITNSRSSSRHELDAWKPHCGGSDMGRPWPTSTRESTR